MTFHSLLIMSGLRDVVGNLQREVQLMVKFCPHLPHLPWSHDWGNMRWGGTLNRPPEGTNWMNCCIRIFGSMFGMTLINTGRLAGFCNTWSWQHLYRPWSSTILQPLRMCCRFALPRLHRTHSSSELSLWELARVSYVVLIKTPSWAKRHLPQVQPIDFVRMPFHVVHLPCSLWPTAEFCQLAQSGDSMVNTLLSLSDTSFPDLITRLLLLVSQHRGLQP